MFGVDLRAPTWRNLYDVIALLEHAGFGGVSSARCEVDGINMLG